MDPTLSPQIRAVLQVLQGRMGGEFNNRFAGEPPPATFNERFPVDVPSHEIEYGMSKTPYDEMLMGNLFDQGMPSPAGEE